MFDVSPFGIPVRALTKEAQSVDETTFAQRHASAFLVRIGSNAVTPRVPMRTQWRSTPDDAVTDDTELYALYVRKRPTTQHAFISIGRLDGNDIAIADDSVSKFHAYIKAEAGHFTLQDARSKNGTAVDGVEVAARGEGPPTPLASGQSVRIGSVLTSFLDAKGLLTIIQQLAERGRVGLAPLLKR